MVIPSRKGRRPGKPRGIRHDRDCSTCKSRGVKCDLNRPGCGPCLRDGIPCGGYTQRVIWTTSNSTRHHPPTTRDNQRPGRASECCKHSLLSESKVLCHAVKPANIPPAHDANWTTHYAKYLEYFCQRVDQSPQADQLHLEALGMVNSGDPLSSVWSFALKRMSRPLSQPPFPGGVTDVDDILSHTTAVAALRHAVERSGIKAIFGIATFAFIDVYKGPFGAWQQHLKGARAVLDSYGTTEEQLAGLCSQTSGLREILSLLCWYDVTGLVVRRDRGLIFEDRHRRFMDDGIFDLVGCPKDTFTLLTAIAKLGFPDVTQEPNLHLSAADQLMRVSDGTQSHSHLLNDAWRYAVVLAVFEADPVRQMDDESRVKRDLIDRICQILETIPPQSARYRHLPFAAFMAGRHAQLPQQARAVTDYWRTCLSFQDSIYPDGEHISQIL